MTRLVTRAEFARIAGVAKPSITKAAAKQFPQGCIGPRIDLDHPDVEKYLASRDRTSTRAVERAVAPAGEPTREPSTRPSAPPAARPQRAAPPSAAPPIVASPPVLRSVPTGNPYRDVSPDDIDRYLHLTLQQITDEHGTFGGFVEMLKARKQMSDIREKDLRNDERTGRLIPREWVMNHMLALVATTYTGLLQDSAPNITRTVYNAAKAGVSIEQAEAMVREALGKQLARLKERAAVEARKQSA